MIHLPHGSLDFRPHRPLVMGILNVTPDSFSDGGEYLSVGDAIQRAETMIGDGADIIDVGPESTRPGSLPVGATEQIRRAVPVVEQVRCAHPDMPISIDTRLAAVAEATIDAGADIINDVSALRADAEMLPLVAERHVAVILMHMHGQPASMQTNPTYRDVVREVLGFLQERAVAVQEAGLSADRIILDPGIGFGKTTEHNLAILRQLERFVATGFPILLGASRKHFLSAMGFLSDVAENASACRSPIRGASHPQKRVGGSLACVARAMAAGAQIVRVHDVRETRQFIDTLGGLLMTDD